MVFETSTGHRPAAVLAMGVRPVDQGDLRQQAHRGRPPSIRAFCVRRDLSAPVDDRPGTRAWLCHRCGRRRNRRLPGPPLAAAPAHLLGLCCWLLRATQNPGGAAFYYLGWYWGWIEKRAP